MKIIDILFRRYRLWKISKFNPNKENYKKLETMSQKPIAMIISCCDSRVNVNSIFGGELGDYFIHKNIANIVPKNKLKTDNTGTLSAIEYALKSLKVSQIIVLGHSNCGGIQYGFEIYKNKKIKKDYAYINKWLENLKDPFEKILSTKSKKLDLSLLEKENIKYSINNLLTYPFIKKMVDRKKLKISGLWYEIKSGKLTQIHYSGKVENIKN